MTKWLRFGAAAMLALLLGAMFGRILTIYYDPMEDASYDLSLSWATEAVPEDWVYDQKGWTVFTQEGERMAELTPDGFGGFTGLGEPGQTFYFSRVIEEELDSPTLRLGTANRTFSVFLDGTLVYTDCPELDNRIGFLRLPTLEWDREESLLISLPLDCAGKTLTIAQSTDPGFEGEHGRVWPCTVTLYCGYTYESGLISESFRAAIPATLVYAAGLALLALFLRQAFRGRIDPGILFGALTAFSFLTACIWQPSFRFPYFEASAIDVQWLCRYLALLALLFMLLCRLSGRRRLVLGAAAAAVGIFIAAELLSRILTGNGGFVISLPFSIYINYEWPGTIALLLAPALGLRGWKRREPFFLWYCPLVLAGFFLYALPGLFEAYTSLSLFFLRLTNLSALAALVSAIAEWVQEEVARRTENRLLLQRNELAQDNYALLRRQHEQVMMLRHDMMKHLRFLQQIAADEKTISYLDELIGENEKIRSVIQSGNEVLDIILNSKLNVAAESGIAVEIVRMQAPAALPLTDAELCSLVMNLLDNALEAAAAPGLDRQYLKLDLFVKKHFFILFCENAATLQHIERRSAPEHGLGLKIIKQIAERYEILLETEYGSGYYSVKLAIPLE